MRFDTGSHRDIQLCPVCGRRVAITYARKVNIHGPRDKRCPGSGQRFIYPPLTSN